MCCAPRKRGIEGLFLYAAKNLIGVSSVLLDRPIIEFSIDHSLTKTHCK